MGNSTGRGSQSRFRKGGCAVRGWAPGLYRKFLKENKKQTQVHVGYFIAAAPIFFRPYTFFFSSFLLPRPPRLFCCASCSSSPFFPFLLQSTPPLLSPPLPSFPFLFLIPPFSFSLFPCFCLSPSSSRPPRLNAPKSLRANKFPVGSGMSPGQNKTQSRHEPLNFHSGPAKSCKSGPHSTNFFFETAEK